MRPSAYVFGPWNAWLDVKNIVWHLSIFLHCKREQEVKDYDAFNLNFVQPTNFIGLILFLSKNTNTSQLMCVKPSEAFELNGIRQ